jgi:hypothetical protein
MHERAEAVESMRNMRQSGAAPVRCCYSYCGDCGTQHLEAWEPQQAAPSGGEGDGAAAGGAPLGSTATAMSAGPPAASAPEAEDAVACDKDVQVLPLCT